MHGYNGGPWGWGVTSARGTNKDDHLVSTKIEAYDGSDPGVSHLPVKIAEDIYGSAVIPFSHYKSVDSYFEHLLPNRFLPSEEAGSYTDTNHTFVELYCSSYSFEADDGTDATALCPLPGYSQAQCDADSNLCYKLTSFKQLKIGNSPYGGQTQLIRMRIVQMLNEYYGDWKWLNDPTAKINIVVHSNGGLIVTNALKNDELYYNAGKSLNSAEYYINGLGVRLNDHVNQVQSIDTPFDGSPLGASDVGWKVKYSKWQWLATHFFFESFIPMSCDPVLTAMRELILLPGLSALINEHIVQETVRTDQPISAGFNATGAFLTGLRGDGKAPAYSDQEGNEFYSQEPGKKIPYVNYVGVTQDVGTLMAALSTIPAAAYAYSLTQCILPWRSWNCSPCKLYSAFMQTAGCIMMSAWGFSSDLVVSKESQQMTTLYSDTDPKRLKTIIKYRVGMEPFHLAMPVTMNDEVIRRLNSNPEFKITYAIGANQDTIFNLQSFFSPAQPDTSDAIRQYGKDCIYLHSIGQFSGMDTAAGSSQWPATDSFGTIRSTAATGKAVKLVGYIKNAFMDHLNLWVYVNQDSFPMVFNDHYGKWASRYIDRDWDGRITDNDWPGGSWFCTPDISCKIKEGENFVTIVAGRSSDTYPINLTNPDTLMATVKIICGTPLGLFEADDAGIPVIPSFINMPMRWDISGGEEKNVYIGISDTVTRTSGDGIKIVRARAAGCATPVELAFNEPASCAVLDPGEFCASANSSMPGLTLLRLKLGQACLKTSGAEVTVDQELHFRFYDTGLSVWSNASVPFYIDNDPVQIKVFSPSLKGDYNHDGVVDANDSCGVDNSGSLPSVCDDASCCADPTMTSEECTLAKAMCNSFRSSAGLLNLSDCDGIDNDFDGQIDADDDVSEMASIEYYSPHFNSAGKLTTKPVTIDFSITDNLQSRFPFPKKLAVQVYKVSGNSFNPVSDQLVYTEDRGSGADSIDIWRYGEFSYDWPFIKNRGGTPFDSINPPPDGLYCAVITGLDLAGDTATADEITSSPAYFIVDRTPPSFTILQNWHDPATGAPVLNPATEQFNMSYRPGPPSLTGTFSNRFDSEIFDLEVRFYAKPVLGTPGTSDTGFITVNSIPVYQDIIDNGRFLANDSNFQVPDGQIDPSTCNLEPGTQWSSDPVIRRALIAALSSGRYSVEYIAKDKAGNVTTVHDTSFVITVERPEGFEEARLDERIGIVDSADAIWNGDNVDMVSKNNNSDDGDSTTDEGVFISYIPYTGPCGQIIKVRNVTSTASSYSVLVELRNSLAVGDISATVEVTNTGSVVFSFRSTTGGNRAVIAEAYVGRMTNVWLKLVRDAAGFVTAWYSLDGVSFTILGTVNFGTQVAILGPGFKQNNGSGVAQITVSDPVVVSWSPVQPVLNSVVNNCNGTYTASFGYSNSNGTTVVLGFGSNNYLFYRGATLSANSRPTFFDPGSHSNVFTIDFDGSPLTWNLNGNVVTATSVPAPCEPIPIPSTVSGYSVYGLNQVNLGDRTELICGSGKCSLASGDGSGVTIGVQSKVKSIESRGQVTLRNYAICSDFIKSASTVTLLQGATCPLITQNYVFPGGVLPSTIATSNIDFTGVPQTNTIVASYQTRTLAPGKYWNYSCQVNGKLKLSAGSYYFHDLNMENNSTIECTVSGGAVKIYIQNYYYSGATCNIIGGDASKVLYGYIGTNAVMVEKLKGTLLAPNAVINAGGWGKVFYGQLIGKNVIMQPDCKVYLMPFGG